MRCVNKAAIGKHLCKQSVIRVQEGNGAVVAGQCGIICLVNGGDDSIKETQSTDATIASRRLLPTFQCECAPCPVLFATSTNCDLLPVLCGNTMGAESYSVSGDTFGFKSYQVGQQVKRWWAPVSGVLAGVADAVLAVGLAGQISAWQSGALLCCCCLSLLEIEVMMTLGMTPFQYFVAKKKKKTPTT